jgi:uncharacterized protein involved in exopolysaccharide biosynthesis
MKFRRLRPLAVFLFLIVPAILASAKDEDSAYEQLVKEANRNPRDVKTPEVSVHSAIDQVFDDLHDYLHPDAFADPTGSLDEARHRLNQQALAAVALDTTDPQMRRAAVSALTDEELLAEVARTASNPVVRLSATRKLTDLIMLAEIAESDPDPNVRHVAASRLEELRDPEAFACGQVTIELYDDSPYSAESGTPSFHEPQPASPEGFAAHTEILSTPAFAEAVATRLSDEERERFLTPYTFESRTGTSAPDLADILTLNTTVTLTPETGTVVIRYTHPDPEVAALVANVCADEFITANVRLLVEAVQRDLQALRERLQVQRAEADALREQLAALQAKAQATPLTREEAQTQQTLEKELKEAALTPLERKLSPQSSQAVLPLPSARVVERAQPRTRISPSPTSQPLYYAQALVQVLPPSPNPTETEESQTRDRAYYAEQLALARSEALTDTVSKTLTPEERQQLLAPYTQDGKPAPALAEIIGRNRVAEATEHSRPGDGEVTQTRLIRFGYYHPDPEVAALVANRYADALITENIRLQVGSAMRAVEDLRKRADEIRANIKNLQEQLAPLQKKAATAPLTPDEDKRVQGLQQAIEAETSVLAEVIQRLEEEKNSIALDEGGLTPRIVERAKPPASPIPLKTGKHPVNAPAAESPDRG